MAIMYYVVFLLLSLIFHGHARANSAMFSNTVASKQYFCSFRYSVHIPKYTGKYLFRRISRASNGSYNPLIITNKQGHIKHGNPFYFFQKCTVTVDIKFLNTIVKLCCPH